MTNKLRHEVERHIRMAGSYGYVKIHTELLQQILPKLADNHRPVYGIGELGVCVRCGNPSADPIHHPVFPGDLNGE